MTNLILLFIMILFTSCGELLDTFDVIDKEYVGGDPRKFTETNPIFFRYKNNYERLHVRTLGKDADTTSIPINLVDSLDDATMGVCFRWLGSKYREILINQNRWYRLSTRERELLINHELGHCHLNRDHDNSTDYRGPLSIMNQSFIGGSLYRQYQNEYENELFTKNKNIFYSR